VVFRLQDRQYAFPLATVEEVLRMVAITEVPESPDWIAGVINLRGRTVPVVDLRTRLGLPPRAPSLDTAIVVTESLLRGSVAFLADEIIDVISVPAESIDRVDELTGTAQPVYAMARNDERLIGILAVGRLAGDGIDLGLPEVIS
jgi:purine-binding chemotaxis protein CheW